ncbi:VCBS repeat-containing protein [Streptomyces sp. NRRL B-24572]|uniref:FG-GAP repeat domain-containing protein n=1 Tax=Streptomyces sp. NRRL B-24572 TaxID=1962156 RepID=UPI000A368565|nr:VCBS repeat-containing protein [Streptomyces sp. NRRL B-24572]
MKHTRISGRRLAAAVLTLATVASVTGTLVTAPAFAATTAEGRCAPTAAGLLPVGAEVVSTGAYGYVTTCTDENGTTALEWHHTDGTVSTLSGPNAYDSTSDYMLTGDGSMFTAYNPATTTYANLNIGVFGSGAQLVGIVRDSLFVSVPSGTENYRDLWKLTQVNGVVQKTKLTSGMRKNVDFKVVATDGTNMVVLGTEMVQGTSGLEPKWWSATTGAFNNSVVDWGGSTGTAQWSQSSTGALTANWQAWVHSAPEGGLEIRAEKLGTTTVTRIPLTDAMAGAVVAGIVGDTILYGVPGTATAENPSPLYARSLTDAGAQPYKLLANFSSVAHAPDGTLLVRGFGADGDGVFRISGSGGARPTVALEATTGRVLGVQVTGSKVPATVSLEKPGTEVPMEWTLSRGDVDVEVTLTHAATGKKLVTHLVNPVSGNTFRLPWNGVLDGVSAPNGDYTWSVKATPSDGTAPATASGGFAVTRTANPHDFTDNGSTDVLARDASGTLWRDDLFDWPVGSQINTARRTKIGSGWGTYKQIEAVGNIIGRTPGDLVALDGTGVLWLYSGKGDGTFATRTKVGGGWGVYNKMTGGSDLTGGGRSDLLATDTSGVLWLYPSTGDLFHPFGNRVKIGGGWGIYNQITAVGNIAGSSADDLVARDTSGVLWLYQGNGSGGFSTRVKVGSGWGAFSQLVGAGDVNADGRPDLIAYGTGGTYVYKSTGSATAPFTRLTTNLYAGEGTKFNSVS